MNKEFDFVRFDKYGLVIGLMSYPFHQSGKKLFQSFKTDLFEKHKHNIETNSGGSLENDVYVPRGYRLFGDRGLAVLSLIDEYAFPNRIFNHNHHHYTNNRTANPKEAHLQYDAKIITGVLASRVLTEEDLNGSESPLQKRVKETFLQSEERFPFIAIARVKINHRLLRKSDGGMHLTIAIKEWVESKAYERKIGCVVVECFDNDEMAVLLFSNDLGALYDFSYNIKCLKYDTLELTPYVDENGDKKETHVFLSCHINIGYDVEGRFDGPKRFVAVDDNPDVRFLQPKEIPGEFRIEFLYEAQPGHRLQLLDDLLRKFQSRITYLTGGHKDCWTLPVHEIHVLEDICETEEFHDHIRGVEVTLCHIPPQESPDTIEENHAPKPTPDRDIRISEDTLHHVQKILNSHGIAKVVRERLLSLFRLYNDNCDNLLHAVHIEELKSALEEVPRLLKSLTSERIGESIRVINDKVSELISVFEEAFYNRSHIWGLESANLEYNGGVQQYLTGIDYAYKRILDVFGPRKEEKDSPVFVHISGHARERSTSMYLQLNINQITHPELLAYSVWKEAANFVLPIYFSSDSQNPIYGQWERFVKSGRFAEQGKFRLHENGYIPHQNETYAIVGELMDEELIDYFVLDQVLFHFGYQREYSLFWHFAWKAFMQSGSCFSRYGEVSKKDFVRMLLRMVMVGINNDVKDLERLAAMPFDSSLGGAWIASFEQVMACSKVIREYIADNGFDKLHELRIVNAENKLTATMDYLQSSAIGKDEKQKLDQVLERRAEKVEKIRELLSLNMLIDPDDGADNPDYVVCLLNAFLRQVKQLDGDGLMKLLPRDEDGHNVLAECIESNMSMINMLVDARGGFYVFNPDKRKEYFALSTALHKSLWHFRMVTSK